MSLAEVDVAADSLSADEKEELLRFLAARLSGKRPRTEPLPPIDRLARLREMYPRGPVKGDVQNVIDYDRDLS
jgi:hypothetical protein